MLEAPCLEFAKLSLALLKALLEFSSLIEEGGMFSFGYKASETEEEPS